MKRFAMCGLIGCLAAAAFLVGRAQSQDAKSQGQAAQQPTPEQMQEMMKKWQESITPGAGHKELEHFAGQWDFTMRVWMEGPAGPPTESKGSSTMRWVLGGRFILDEMKGEVIGPKPDGTIGSMAMEGMGLTGYDNFLQTYVGCWADNMNTFLLTFSGTFDSATKTFTYEGDMAEPMMNIKARKVRYTTKITGPDSHIFAIYDLAVGPDYKVVEIAYIRKK